MSTARALVACLIVVAASIAASGGPHASPRGPRAQGDEPRTIAVTASRFAFDPATIEVAVGERVRLVMKSADGVHGLEIKKFKVKKEIPRGGTPVTVEFTANAAGRYPILCSEYCGDDHDAMRGTLVVVASEDAAR